MTRVKTPPSGICEICATCGQQASHSSAQPQDSLIETTRTRKNYRPQPPDCFDGSTPTPIPGKLDDPIPLSSHPPGHTKPPPPQVLHRHRQLYNDLLLLDLGNTETWASADRICSMANLGVNIDHVATVRQARRTDEPDPVWAAAEAELGGADCITFHLREDRRHICDRDARLLKQTVSVKLNMEMAIAPEIVNIACEIQPDQSTIVPERREELTTEGGLDVVKHSTRVKEAVSRLVGAGAVVSAFIEPIPDQIKASADTGCKAIELWTGAYAHAKDPDARKRTLDQLVTALQLGHELGLEVHGGHGLTYRNVAAIASVNGFSEFNIGHSIVSRAVFVGMREAVRQMKDLLTRYAPRETNQ